MIFKIPSKPLYDLSRNTFSPTGAPQALVPPSHGHWFTCAADHAIGHAIGHAGVLRALGLLPVPAPGTGTLLSTPHVLPGNSCHMSVCSARERNTGGETHHKENPTPAFLPRSCAVSPPAQTSVSPKEDAATCPCSCSSALNFLLRTETCPWVPAPTYQWQSPMDR